jgi:cell fate regulator YaaT (PSP1 superfamily)
MLCYLIYIIYPIKILRNYGMAMKENMKENINTSLRANEYAWCIRPATIREAEYEFCKEQASHLSLPMRLIQANQQENKLVFFFTAPERVDFRELLKILRHRYHNFHIELRQIGQRDASSLLSGVGICGQQLCCSAFLKEFYPITAKKAKKVGPTPNPAMYCGVCGRLRCCLRYEVEEEAGE